MNLSMRKDYADQFCHALFVLTRADPSPCPLCGQTEMNTVGRWSGGAKVIRQDNLLVAQCHACNARFNVRYDSANEYEPKVLSIHRTV